MRLALWFGFSILAIILVFVGFTYHQMTVELTQKHWQRDYPDHPDWKLHGSFSEAEVRDIMGELVEGWIGYSLPMIAVTLVVGYYIARKSLRPIQRVNEQLQRISPKNLDQKIVLHEGDKEFRHLLDHINDLLGRLNNSFTEMSEYSAKVAHELRTPLAIMRLKVEQADNKIEPELSEDLQEELHRLTHVVDQSLLIAKAEQGRLVWQREVFDLSEMVTDVTRDFELLATESGRSVRVRTQPGCLVDSDAQYFKQVLHNLLTNALKHGQGDIVVRLMRKQSRGGLIIFNRVPKQPVRADKTLTMGLRVVNALLSHQPEIEFRSGARNGHYAARVRFICATNA
ncbi:MAG: histidine kinase dimerization/phospho-acceptor domain-containing protein [Limisphaerales bacterium]